MTPVVDKTIQDDEENEEDDEDKDAMLKRSNSTPLVQLEEYNHDGLVPSTTTLEIAMPRPGGSMRPIQRGISNLQTVKRKKGQKREEKKGTKTTHSYIARIFLCLRLKLCNLFCGCVCVWGGVGDPCWWIIERDLYIL